MTRLTGEDIYPFITYLIVGEWGLHIVYLTEYSFLFFKENPSPISQTCNDKGTCGNRSIKRISLGCDARTENPKILMIFRPKKQRLIKTLCNNVREPSSFFKKGPEDLKTNFSSNTYVLVTWL